MGGPAPPAPIAVDETSEWKQYLRDLRTKGLRTKNISTAKRQVRIAIAILNRALGSHKVRNAYFPLDFASDWGVFGHSLADLMHLLEEGLLKYLLSVFLDPLPVKTKSKLDDLIAELLGPKANRQFGSRLFPRANFT